MLAIHWFRRDLRLADNTALLAAAQQAGGNVLPVFVLDDALLKQPNVAAVRVAFMLACLSALDGALRKRGSRLIVLRGDPAEALTTLARQTGASALFFNRDYTPAARKRDARVSEALSAAGVQVNPCKDTMVFEPDEVLTAGSSPYTVFTPYKKNWLARWDAHPQPPAGEPVALLPVPATVAAPEIPSAAALGFASSVPIPKAGEAHAAQMLQAFAEERLNSYAAARDVLSEEGTSRLSPHLRFGTVSPRQCVHAAIMARTEEGNSVFAAKKKEANGADVWISELIWREFYMQVLWHHPHADRGSFKPEYDAMQWGSGNAKRDAELFAAWCEGRTGYPIVDAAMRQLNTTGWMHNRARMIVASFLTKDLMLDWRLGEAYFMKHLVDGDPASNNGGWQWAASTGTDAQPYFRVFNPWLQSVRFDPDGKYIRRYVKELERCPQEFIHEPGKVPPMLSLTTNTAAYPKPIVDHATQKDEVLRRFEALKRK